MINYSESFGNAIGRLGRIALWSGVIGICSSAVAAIVLFIQIGALNQSLFPSMAIAAIVFALTASSFRLVPMWLEARTGSREVEPHADLEKSPTATTGSDGSADPEASPMRRSRTMNYSVGSMSFAKPRPTAACPRIRCAIIEDIK